MNNWIPDPPSDDETEEHRRILEQDLQSEYAEELYEQKHPHVVRDENDL